MAPSLKVLISRNGWGDKVSEVIKADLLAAYKTFIHDFADPVSVSKKEIEGKMDCEVKDLFSHQRSADLAKKTLGGDFKKAVALYFDRYQTKGGLNYHLLLKDLEVNEPALTLHLKKDAVRYVRLLAQIMSRVDLKPKGLLA